MLSVAINIKNGAKHLELCLNALKDFPEVVLLDNYSTDETLDIAKKYHNVKVWQSEFNGMGCVRNLLASYATHDWVFFIDCDEIVSESLVTYLLNHDFENATVYSIRRLNYYAGELVDSSNWENDWVRRIYNKRETQYLEQSVHESVDTSNLKVEKIVAGNIYHFPYASVAELLEKTQFYSALYAQQNFLKKRVQLWTIPFRAVLTFIKCYLLKGGFKGGYAGFVVSSFNAIGVFVKYVKLYELSNEVSVNLLLDLRGLPVDKTKRVLQHINAQNNLPQKVYLIVADNGFDKKNNLYCKSLLLWERDVSGFDLAQDDDVYRMLNIKSRASQKNCILYLTTLNLLSNSSFLAKCKKEFNQKQNNNILRK